MILVPEWVARNERQRTVLEEKSESFDHNGDWKRWNSLLRDIDPRLSYVFVPVLEQLVVGVIPLRWHIVRVNESGPDCYWPLLTEDGGYREIGSNDLEDFKGRDLWNPAVRHELTTMRRRKLESKARAKVTKKEQRIDELTSNVNAIRRPSVLVSDVPWTNRSAGKRGRKA